MSNEYMAFILSTRGKNLADERECLSKLIIKLRKEIRNGAARDQAWIDSKNAKFKIAWNRYCEVNDLIVAGRVTRNRASGGDNGLGTKNNSHFPTK